MNSRRLHIGALRATPGWETLNAKALPGIDHVCDARDLSRFAEGTFSALYASHVLEHFDYRDEVLAVLKEWFRVLAPSGTIHLSVPDLDIICRLYCDRERFDGNDRFLFMRMIMGGHCDRHDYHLAAFNEETLGHYLGLSGFERIQRVGDFGFFEDTSKLMHKGALISLNLTAEKPSSRYMPEPISTSASITSGDSSRQETRATVRDDSASPPKGPIPHHALSGRNNHGRYVEVNIQKAQMLYADNHSLEAFELFRDLALLDPDDPRICYHLGRITMEQFDYQSAGDHFRTLVRLRPDFCEGRVLLGMALTELGQPEEAVELIQGVIAECPGVAEFHYHLALGLAAMRRNAEAFDEYQRVLRLSPDHVGALYNLGILFSKTGRTAEARTVLLQALDLKPDAVHIINSLSKICENGHAGDALHWLQVGLNVAPDHAALISNYLYMLNYVPGLSPEFIAAKHREYAPRAYPPPTACRPAGFRRNETGGRIRIGYLSADFHSHSVSFFLEPVMRCHDRSRFELFCYANQSVSDAITERLQTFCTGWRCISGMTDRAVADLIAIDGIDILVELSGHTSGNRLGVCALHPAPVQVSWIGYPNTTGLPQIDYYLTDAWCDPPGMTEDLYSEQLHRLPRVFCCYQPPDGFPPVAPPPVLDSGTVTFGSFNRMVKINDELVSLWARILAEVPGSRLLVKGAIIHGDDDRAELSRFFEERGIPEGRVILHGVTSTIQEHLALYARVDIALDTFPYHGTTTTCEALWMGVPVVTLAGRTHASRVGVSLLHSSGLPELVAKTPEQYVSTAVALANNRQRLTELRNNLRPMMQASALMDAEGVTRDVEAAYMTMMSLSGCVVTKTAPVAEKSVS